MKIMITRLAAKIIKRLRVSKAIYSARKNTERKLSKPGLKNILVLCYGNIYRSPLVAEYLRAKLDPAYDIKSAGFYPKINRLSTKEHIEMCAEHQIDLSNHKSSVVDDKLVNWADVIIIMDRHNWYDLAEFGDEAVSKAVWLGALLSEPSVEILDPYGKTDIQARNIVSQLLKSSKELADLLSASEL